MNRYLLYLFRTIAIAVFIALVVVVFFIENYTSLVWTIVVPVIPLLFVVFGYSNWRKICPLAFFSTLSQHLTWIPKRKMPHWFEENFYYFQYFLLFLAFSARLIILNFDPFYLALFFVFIIVMAFLVNLIYTGKSWCNFICPVGIVEKIYCGSNAHNYQHNSACDMCSACKKNCPDIDMESNYWKETTNKQKVFVFYSFSGLILGFYLYFYLFSGSFTYYFTGEWTLNQVSPLASGFFFAPFIPLFIAVPITLIVFSLSSFYLFKSIEMILWKKHIIKNIDYSTLIHRIKIVAAFIAFNIFYLFAGAPAYEKMPLLYGSFHFFVIMISAIVMYREFFREEGYFIQERFAIKMIKMWKSDKPIPTNLKEIYYTYANEKKNKAEQLKMYKESLSDLMQEGILTEESMVLLEKLRGQMGISQKDHLDTIRAIKLNNEDLFDNEIEKSAERRYQKNHYKQVIEEALSEYTTLDSNSLDKLQKQFCISDEEHKDIVEKIMNSNQKLVNRVIGIVKEMEKLSTIHASYYDDRSIETNFLKFSLRNQFNILSEDLFTIFNLIYENHEEELKPLSEIFKYERGELLLKCKEEISSFMDKDIVNVIIELIIAIDTYHETVDEAYNVVFLKSLLENDSLELSTVALLSLKKYDSTLYADISYERFISSSDINVVAVACKIQKDEKSITVYEKLMYLHSIPFFMNITFKELYDLSHHTELVKYNAKDVIIQQGDEGDSLFMLVDGEVEVEVDSKSVTTLSKGEYFGEIAIVADVDRTASVIALKNIIVLKLSSEEFKTFVLDNPHVSINLMKEITLRLLQNTNL